MFGLAERNTLSIGTPSMHSDGRKQIVFRIPKTDQLFYVKASVGSRYEDWTGSDQYLALQQPVQETCKAEAEQWLEASGLSERFGAIPTQDVRSLPNHYLCAVIQVAAGSHADRYLFRPKRIILRETFGMTDGISDLTEKVILHACQYFVDHSVR